MKLVLHSCQKDTELVLGQDHRAAQDGTGPRVQHCQHHRHIWGCRDVTDGPGCTEVEGVPFLWKNQAWSWGKLGVCHSWRDFFVVWKWHSHCSWATCRSKTSLMCLPKTPSRQGLQQGWPESLHCMHSVGAPHAPLPPSATWIQKHF